MCEICLKITIKTSERLNCQLDRSIFKFNIKSTRTKFDNVVLIFLLSTSNKLPKDYRGVFTTLSNIYNGDVFTECLWILSVKYFFKKTPSQMFERVLTTPLLYLSQFTRRCVYLTIIRITYLKSQKKVCSVTINCLFKHFLALLKS